MGSCIHQEINLLRGIIFDPVSTQRLRSSAKDSRLSFTGRFARLLFARYHSWMTYCRATRRMDDVSTKEVFEELEGDQGSETILPELRASHVPKDAISISTIVMDLVTSQMSSM